MPIDTMPRQTPQGASTPDNPASSSLDAHGRDALAAAFVAQPVDALAGALPVWDLLPATPFIRRVK